MPLCAIDTATLQHIGVHSACPGVYLFEGNATLGEVDARLDQGDAKLDQGDARLDQSDAKLGGNDATPRRRQRL